MPQTQTDIHRQAHALASEMRLTREERIDLAEMLLKRDVGSWTALDEDETRRLVDALQGFAYIHFLMQQRP